MNQTPFRFTDLVVSPATLVVVVCLGFSHPAAAQDSSQWSSSQWNRSAASSNIDSSQNFNSSQSSGYEQTLPATSALPQSNLRTIQVPDGQAEVIATRIGLRYRDQPSVNVSFDDRDDLVIVMAPDDVQDTIFRQIDDLLDADRRLRSKNESGDEFSHRLLHLSTTEFEHKIAKLCSAPASVTQVRSGQIAVFRMTTAPMMGSTIEINRRTSVVRVRSDYRLNAGWKKLILALDAPVEADPQYITTVVRLKKAEPAPIQRAIRLIGELKAGESPSGRPNQRTQNNTRAQNNRRSPFRTAAFQEGDLPDTDNAANEDAAPAGGIGGIGDTQIEFVPELGTIIIKGAKRDVQRVMDVIKEIEKQSEVTKPEVEIVQLQHADANAVETLLKQLYADVLSARQGEVSITSLDTPNALLLFGRAEAIKSVLELIQKIDQPLPDSDRLRIFRLQHASATDAESTIRDFFTNRPGDDDDVRPGLGGRVRVLGDYRTNSLIVSASPRDMEEISRLIRELDVQNISSENQIKVFPLNNALAEDLAPVIQDAIAAGEEDDSNPSASLSIVTVNASGNQVLDSGILSGATVTADSNGNALVVRAPAASLPLIGELIRQLDQAPGFDSLVKVFTIENGDAVQLTAALIDLFGDDASTGGTSVGAGNLASLPPLTGSQESSLVPLRFSSDQRTNSIIASGSAEDLEVVESILLRLDTAGFAERITEVIWLRHQSAADIALALQTYVQERTRGINSIQQFQQGGLGPLDLPDRDLIVVPELATNSLLLSVSPRLYEDVRRLIDRLDRRPPMILIKVVLAEVTLGDTFEIGGELGLQDSLLYDRGIAEGAIGTGNPGSVPGFNFNNNGTPNVNSFAQEAVGGRGLTSLGVGATTAGSNFGGFVLSAASESVSMLFRTLQTADRLQILSRPQIMTLDNTESFVQVGRQVARITDVLNNINTTQLVTEDIEVGLILRVRPRVGADGLIIIDIDATRSERDASNGTTIGQFDDGAPIVIDDIIRTTAQSTVAAYSGQTVIFGGLIQKTRTNLSRRVPLLADIPVVGNFFKFDRETETRSETLIVMTPMLVTGEEDLEYVKQTESSRMSWCLADVVEMHGDVGLDGGYGLWGPAVGQTIYPDIQPTVDDIFIGEDLSLHSNRPMHGDGMHGDGSGVDGSGVEYPPSSGYPVQGSEPMMLDGDAILQSPNYGQPNYGQPSYSQPGFSPSPATSISPAPPMSRTQPTKRGTQARQVGWTEMIQASDSLAQ